MSMDVVESIFDPFKSFVYIFCFIVGGLLADTLILIHEQLIIIFVDQISH